MSDILNPFFATIAKAAEDAAVQRGFALILCNSDEDPAKEHTYLEVLYQKRVSGIMLAPTGGNDALVQQFHTGGLPVVEVDRHCSGTIAVVLDNRAGALAATAHLLDLGHRRIATVAVPQHLSTGRERLEGYQEAFTSRGLEVPKELVRVGDSREGGGYEATRALLALRRPPTALFVANNEMTSGALRALKEAGARVPDDLALVMFDDTSWATLVDPPLTVVAQPIYHMGRRAAEQLFALIDGTLSRSTQVVERLTPTLIVRRSCGGARKGVVAREKQATTCH
ncbi:MAG: substrate-binding domain-containing protein [Deinococcus sp.]|nr:substrate-binding domain-containing protein [Deinococcus sp.]